MLITNIISSHTQNIVVSKREFFPPGYFASFFCYLDHVKFAILMCFPYGYFALNRSLKCRTSGESPYLSWKDKYDLLKDGYSFTLTNTSLGYSSHMVIL